MTSRRPWKVSLHGGHSGAYCDHAVGTLRQVLEAAVAQNFHTFGISEHAPRLHERYLYDTEVVMGWDVAKLEADFERYAADSRTLADEFSDRLNVLRGFEIEVVPEASYAEIMNGFREGHDFDYIVGSVHFLKGQAIDGPKEIFEAVLKEYDNDLESLGEAYYAKVVEMIEALRPEVVGHLDLIRKNAPTNESVDTPRLRTAAEKALEAAKKYDCILDLNTAGYRKGLGSPYPAPWLLKRAHAMGVGVCFGDDSHGPQQVGEGIDDARTYLLENGVSHVRVLLREGAEIVRRDVSLESN